MNPDDKLDQLLSSQPIQPDAAFKDRVLTEILKTDLDAPDADPEPEAAPLPSRKVISFPTVIGGLGLAAAAALTVGIFLKTPSSVPVDSTTLENPTLTQTQPLEDTPLMAKAELTEDELLALEDTLQDLEILFEEDNLEVLALLSDSFNS